MFNDSNVTLFVRFVRLVMSDLIAVCDAKTVHPILALLRVQRTRDCPIKLLVKLFLHIFKIRLLIVGFSRNAACGMLL
jgi:hypothetical protein